MAITYCTNLVNRNKRVVARAEVTPLEIEGFEGYHIGLEPQLSEKATEQLERIGANVISVTARRSKVILSSRAAEELGRGGESHPRVDMILSEPNVEHVENEISARGIGAARAIMRLAVTE